MSLIIAPGAPPTPAAPMPRVTAQIVGDVEVKANLGSAPNKVVANLRMVLNHIANGLVRYIDEKKLTGQVLKVRTGTLRRSVTRTPQGGVDEVAPGKFQVAVGTNVFYGRIWELTGTPAMTIVPVKAKALRFKAPQGHWIFTRRVNKKAVAAKPWLGPALKENEKDIQTRLSMAVQMGLQNRGAK